MKMDNALHTRMQIGPGRKRAVYVGMRDNRSRYMPHQGTQECQRRRDQAFRAEMRRLAAIDLATVELLSIKPLL